MLWLCCRSHIRRLNFFNSIFFLFKRVTGLFFSEIRYIFHGEGVILTANYRTVEVTCRLVLIRLLKSSVSLKKCCRAQGSQTYKSLCCPELASTCQQRLITWCAVWMLRRWGRRLASLVHHILTLTARWKKPPSAFPPRPWGWENESAQDSVSSRPPPVRLTLTSVSERSGGDQTLRLPSLIMGWDVLLSRAF